MLTSTYHAITPTPAHPCRMHCHDADDRPPATWEHRWRTETMPAPAFEDLCEGCASELRRREVDRELREIGARVIRVASGRLARALDAHERGRRELFLRVLPGVEQERAPDGRLVGPILDALHLARLALGEG